MENPGNPLSNAVRYGNLFDPHAAKDGSTNVNGVYTVTGSPEAVTTDIEGLVRFPGLETTKYRIHVTDTAGMSATDTATSVVGLLNSYLFF